MTKILIWLVPVLVSLITTTKGSSVIVEKGHPTSLQCEFPKAVGSITWQLLRGNATVNLSTCEVLNTSCHNLLPSAYQAFINGSVNPTAFGLNVTAASLNETDFACLADSGQKINVSIVVYDPPVVDTMQIYCPYGNEMYNFVFPIGATAFCDCDLEYEGIPKSVPRWFTRNGTAVGVYDLTNNVATVNFTYDYTDPDQSYECRAVNQLNIEVAPFVYAAKFTNDRRVVEIGTPLNLECSFPGNVTSVTWQLLRGSRVLNISTCSATDKNCTDLMPAIYRGSNFSSDGNATAGLTILSVRLNETVFTCLADNGKRSNITQLLVFAQPSVPKCTQQVVDTTVQYNCTTDNIYPELKSLLHRQVVDLQRKEYVSTITYSSYDGRPQLRSATLYFEVSILSTKIHQWTVNVEVIPNIPELSLISSKAVFSADISTTLRVPVVVLNTRYCPSGPGVKGNTIKIGTTATCKCELQFSGVPPGWSEWDSKDSGSSSREFEDGSSTITFTYDPLNKNQSYECRSKSTLLGNQTSVIYRPIFIPSSAQSICPIGLQSTVIILGVLLSRIGFSLG